MKTIFLSFAALFFSVFGTRKADETAASTTPDGVPLCHSVPNDMARFASNPAFMAAHANPAPFRYVSAAGEMIKFKTPDGKEANGFFLKAKQPSDKWLFVYQEWWGLNDNIKQQAEKYYNDLTNVNVLAVDMYDGKVTADRQEAAKLMQGVSRDRLGSIMQGAINYAGNKAKIASVGWCFGGAMSLQSALLEGDRAVGCVMYYGSPEQDVNKLKTLKTDVLGLFASKDGFINPQVVKQFQDNMDKAGKKVEVKMYEADHGFANPSNPIFDKQATADAYQRSLTYLKDRLKA